MILTNLQPYQPDDKPYGDDVIYLQDTAGNDWYQSQSDFAPDTLKVVFDDSGLIISHSRDVSALYPINASVAEFATDIEDATGLYVINGKLITAPKPSDLHHWDGKGWVISSQNLSALRDDQIQAIGADINAKRDTCVNGGVYVAAIGKWIDTDETARATLVEIKADFDLNGEDNTYSLICADNSVYQLDYAGFKAAWNAAKKLKEDMFENAYMHKVLLEAEDNPQHYDWQTVGWAQTYEDYLAEQNAKMQNG